MRKWMLTMVAVLILCVGCVTSEDPETGKKKYSVDPNAAEKVEASVEAGITLLKVLSIAWPPLLSVVSIAGGGLAVWRKAKPQITKAQSEAEIYHTLGSVTVDGINEWRKLFPEQWEQLKEELDKLKDKALSPEDRKKIENLIRGFRGKPPKE